VKPHQDPLLSHVAGRDGRQGRLEVHADELHGAAADGLG
jgi:hypothetical protein